MADKATFAGGCFWCMVAPFQELEGVTRVVSGFTGGDIPSPSYEAVVSGSTGHLEAVQIEYDPKKVDYADLVSIFWQNIDPTDDGGQFADRGSHYLTAIFYHTANQQEIAESSKHSLDASKKFNTPIVTSILPALPFYPAEDYHQDYHSKNPIRYQMYKRGSGRASFIKDTWGKPPSPQLSSDQYDYKEEKSCLTDLQYHVTQEGGTERPFNNLYWDNKDAGLYVDIVSGEALFASIHKFESGTGWPSFYKTIATQNVEERTDESHGMVRTEVVSARAQSHLGHLFNDGPSPTGLRYCINSAALRFIPVNELMEKGYKDYIYLFEPAE